MRYGVRIVQTPDVDLQHILCVRAAVFRRDNDAYGGIAVIDGFFFRLIPAVFRNPLHDHARDGTVSVSQAESERIQRRPVVIAVSAVLHGIIREVRQILRILIEGHRKLAGRRDLAEKNLCEIDAAPCARIKGLDYRICLFLRNRKIDGTAREVDDDDRLFHRQE